MTFLHILIHILLPLGCGALAVWVGVTRIPRGLRNDDDKS